MPYAAYDHNAIYAIGDTPEDAIAAARTDAPEATFKTVMISAADAARIEHYGFDGHADGFEIKNGRVVLDWRR